MRNILFFSAIAVLLSACLGGNDEPEEFICNVTLDISGVDQDQLDADIEIIDQYLADNQITAAVDPSGIRYRILEEGEGTEITGFCDLVAVSYEGRLMEDGSLFDSGSTQFALNNLILGWRIGIPLIQGGGQIILYIPSVYAYGESGAGSTIPPNAVLIFNVTLNDVLQRG